MLWRQRLADGSRATELADWLDQNEVDARTCDAGVPLPLVRWILEAAAGALVADIREPITLAMPDPLWPAMYVRERDTIAAALGSLARRIEHIGSTAVPGLDANPIIDLQVELGSLDDARGKRPAS